jgi:hypothetical protein
VEPASSALLSAKGRNRARRDKTVSSVKFVQAMEGFKKRNVVCVYFLFSV